MAAEDRMRANEQRYVAELELLRSEACGWAFDMGTAIVVQGRRMRDNPVYGRILRRMQANHEGKARR